MRELRCLRDIYFFRISIQNKNSILATSTQFDDVILSQNKVVLGISGKFKKWKNGKWKSINFPFPENLEKNGKFFKLYFDNIIFNF